MRTTAPVRRSMPGSSAADHWAPARHWLVPTPRPVQHPVLRRWTPARGTQSASGMPAGDVMRPAPPASPVLSAATWRRASISVATFAQAISNTASTLPNSASDAVRASPTCRSRTDRTVNPTSLRNCGGTLSRIFANTGPSCSRAWMVVIPGLRRAKARNARAVVFGVAQGDRQEDVGGGQCR